MKKSLMIVASLALGTAALAQDNPATPAPDATQAGAAQTPAEQGSTPSEASQSPSAQSAAPDASGSQPGMTPPAGDTGSAAAGGQGMATGTGGAMGGNMADAQQKAAQTDTSNLPKCSATVKDSCVQAGGATGHKMMHRKTMRHHHVVKKSS